MPRAATTARRRWRSWGRYVDPTSLLRLGKARLTRFLIRHSRGQWREDSLDFAEITGSRHHRRGQTTQVLTEHVEELDERIRNPV